MATRSPESVNSGYKFNRLLQSNFNRILAKQIRQDMSVKKKNNYRKNVI